MRASLLALAVVEAVGRRDGRRYGPVALLRRGAVVVCRRRRDGIVGWRSVLEQRLIVHHVSQASQVVGRKKKEGKKITVLN